MSMRYCRVEGERLKLTEGEFSIVKHICRIGRRRYKAEKVKELREE